MDKSNASLFPKFKTRCRWTSTIDKKKYEFTEKHRLAYSLGPGLGYIVGIRECKYTDQGDIEQKIQLNLPDANNDKRITDFYLHDLARIIYHIVNLLETYSKYLINDVTEWEEEQTIRQLFTRKRIKKNLIEKGKLADIELNLKQIGPNDFYDTEKNIGIKQINNGNNENNK